MGTVGLRGTQTPCNSRATVAEGNRPLGLWRPPASTSKQNDADGVSEVAEFEE